MLGAGSEATPEEAEQFQCSTAAHHAKPILLSDFR